MSGRREVVVLDPRVPDASLLLAGLQPGTQVVPLSASSDGLTQIADALAGPAQTTDIHILGHGVPAVMLLGNDLLNAATVANDTQALHQLATELGPDSDLLLYGCQTGAGTTGAAMVESLARATGATVAASSNSVGAAALDGGWDLNVASGRIDAASPWSIASLADYPDRLGLTITTTTLPNWTVNRPYSQTIATSGGTAPITFAVTAGSLPPGLILNSSTGAITGTPTTTSGSPFSFTIKATDATSATATHAYSVAINTAPTITTTTLPSGKTNQAYSQTIAVTGGTAPVSFSVTAGSLPPGLTLNSSTGAITGAPTTPILTTLATINGSNGDNPQAGLIEDSSGNFFGTTNGGGASGDGTVFEVVAGSGTITALASFNGTNGKTLSLAPDRGQQRQSVRHDLLRRVRGWHDLHACRLAAGPLLSWPLSTAPTAPTP